MTTTTPATTPTEETPAITSTEDPALERWWGRHPQEQGEPIAPRAAPEIGETVPNRHSASAEAALLRWREKNGYG
jgi:hypothetical protein